MADNPDTSKLFADDMMEPVQKWLNAGAEPEFISAALRQFADIIDRKTAEARKDATP